MNNPGLIAAVVIGVVVVLGFVLRLTMKKKSIPKPEIMQQNVEYKQRYPKRAAILENQYLKEDESDDKTQND